MTLKNGINLRIVTPSIPNYISIVLLFKFGVQNETESGSGFCRFLEFSIMNSLSSNPGIMNHIQIQFSKEIFLIKIACMPYQVEEFATLVSKALEKSSLDLDLLRTIEPDPESENKMDELLELSAYGHSGKGKPLYGFPENLKNPEEMFLECLRLHDLFVGSNNMVACAGGVFNQSDFIQILESKFKSTGHPPLPTDLTDEYKPSFILKPRINEKNDVFIDQEDLEAEQFGIAFPTFGLKSDEFYALSVLETMIGESSYFSSGGPGKGMHALAVKLLRECGPSTAVKSFYNAYATQGLFGIVIKGSRDSSKQIHSSLVKFVNHLPTSYNLDDFNRAKSITVTKTLMSLEGQHSLIEEYSTDMHYFGYDSKVSQYKKDIESVQLDQVRLIIDKMMTEKPTYAAVGNFGWLQNESEKSKSKYFSFFK